MVFDSVFYVHMTGAMDVSECWIGNMNGWTQAGFIWLAKDMTQNMINWRQFGCWFAIGMI